MGDVMGQGEITPQEIKSQGKDWSGEREDSGGGGRGHGRTNIAMVASG